MKNQCEKSVGFHLEPLCGFKGYFIYAKYQWSIFMRLITSFFELENFPVISTVECNDSVSFSFFAWLLFFFIIKDQIASFKWKQIEKSAQCVFHSYSVVIEFDLWIMAFYK